MNDTPQQDELQLNADNSAFSPPDDDFANLLARVRGGDESAARELVARYERAVLRSVRSRLSPVLRSALDSMDVMQSVHRSLLTGLRIGRFELTSPQHLVGLAVVMVERKVARHWRQLKRCPLARSGAAHPAEANRLETIASREPTPSQIASANDLLERCLAQLNNFDRQLVRLKLAGHSSIESAALLGREPAFIRMRWSRLRQLLRERGHLEA